MIRIGPLMILSRRELDELAATRIRLAADLLAERLAREPHLRRAAIAAFFAVHPRSLPDDPSSLLALRAIRRSIMALSRAIVRRAVQPESRP